MAKRLILLLLVAAGFAVLSAGQLCAQDEATEASPKETADTPKDVPKEEVAEPEAQAGGTVARYITVTNPAGELVFSRIRNALVELQHQADEEDRDTILILEIERGSSTFG